uniref:DNA-directed RNA polymerase n=1 Tax=Armillaria gallica TaxID=47427 RepID=A0A4D6FHH0_ARMGA|nr:RNA polymerase [Armillaria gallica]
MEFGHLLFTILMDEFKFMFTKETIMENGEHHIYITVSKEYMPILKKSFINEVKLPMLYKPKVWTEDLNQEGGYYLNHYNKINNTEIIKQNVVNMKKYKSEISVNQIDTINYLNAKEFVINKEVFEIMLKEFKSNNFNDDKGSLFFDKFNSLHPLTEQLNEISDSKLKKEILAHNSNYWYFNNLLNIASLFLNHSFFLPTYFDFRGRVYPAPNYLSYQGSDIARSLLLFKKVEPLTMTNLKNETIEINSDNYDKHLNIDKVWDNESDKNRFIKAKNNYKNYAANELDYVKLYLANVLGLSKKSRKSKIEWFDKNIENFCLTLESDFEVFKKNILINAKEPAQFLAGIIEHNKYRKNKSHIIRSPYLMPRCSGIKLGPYVNFVILSLNFFVK